MSLSSCDKIETDRAALLALFCEAEAWFDWNLDKRVDLLQRIADFIFQLRDTSPDKPLPPEWQSIFSQWMSGASTKDMVEDTAIQTFTQSPSDLAVFLEQLCGYLLPWGMNSLLTYLMLLAVETETTIPEVCGFFSGMVKYGVSDPIAVCFVPYLDFDRGLALAAASVCPHALDRPDRAIKWLLDASEDDLRSAGLDETTADGIIRRRDSRRAEGTQSWRRRQDRRRLPVERAIFDDVDIGETVLVSQNATIPGEYTVFNLTGAPLGTYVAKKDIPDWWGDLSRVEASIESKEEEDNGELILVMYLREV